MEISREMEHKRMKPEGRRGPRRKALRRKMSGQVTAGREGAL